MKHESREVEPQNCYVQKKDCVEISACIEKLSKNLLETAAYFKR